MASHLSNKRTADTFLQFLMNSSSIIIVFLSELSTAFQVAGGSLPPEQAVNRYLESSPESSLADVLARQQQQKKLNRVADEVLLSFLDPKAYDCVPAKNFFREVLAGVVFESTITSLSRPEFINSWIIYLFSEGESEIMSAIDAGVEGARNQGVTQSKSPGGERNPMLDPADNTSPASRPTSTPVDEQTDPTDKATREAMMEAKRLSDMIAAQEAQRKQEESVSRGGDTGAQGSESSTSALSSGTDTAQPPVGRQAENAESNGTKQLHDTHEQLHAKEPVSPAESRQSMSSQVPAESSTGSELPSGEANAPPFTLHGAYVSVGDVSKQNEKATIKSKPTSEYLLQIEPFATRSTGWMVFRKYADFESLHETLATIARLNRIHAFTDQQPILPPWKGQTKQGLMLNLERYLKDALRHEPLAESGKMKRFLEKDTRLGHQPMGASTKSGLLAHSQNSFENMGKGVLGALSNAPKGVAGGGRAVFDGVSGALGNVASKKPPSSIHGGNEPNPRSLSSENMPEQVGSPGSQRESLVLGRGSGDGSLSPPLGEAQDSPTIDPYSSVLPEAVGVSQGGPPSPSVNESKTGSPTVGQQPAQERASYKSDTDSQKFSGPLSDPEDKEREESVGVPHPHRTEPQTPSDPSPHRQSTAEKPNNSITSEETQIAVELIFAVINELYSMSSVWNIRKTLLNAAKSYILRPGSPNLETIRTLLQDSMIDAHTSDEALAEYLAKLRENALPTETELNAWPPSPSDAEKERLRESARRVFVQRGIPQTLMSVMGAAASREALEKIFDSLQVEDIARGLVFSVIVQAVRAVIL
ncbi:PX domain-containing protein [Aspergillus sp. HF37]|nr:PX domain-containing protein [Aspergillus sp. HF37]